MRTPSPRRGGEPSWMRPITERLSPVIKALVIAETLIFVFYVMVQGLKWFFVEHLALSAAALRGEVWQPVTALFVHLEGFSFFFSLIGLWFFGAAVERQLGTRRFLILFLGSGVAANVAMGLVATALQRGQTI